MNFIHFHKSAKNWQTAQAAGAFFSQRGTMIDGAKTITPQHSAARFGPIKSQDEYGKALLSCNGFYALVTQAQDGLFAAVDQIRSIPLFYGVTADDFYLSDDARWVRQQMQASTIDTDAAQEFKILGHVSGNDTLFSIVKQIQAGEFIHVRRTDGKINVTTHCYYQFTHIEPKQIDAAKLATKLNEVSLSVTRNLIHYAAGRQIVVPLSGGYDSRLICILLKECGYDNVVTFTYGRAGNKEAAYSKEVADKIGYPWVFVEYTDALWKQFWYGHKRWDFQLFSCGDSSLAHYQDVMAVEALKEQNLIEDDCIFVPGHAADFVAGSHIPAAAFTGESTKSSTVINAIYKKYYHLLPDHKSRHHKKFCQKKIRDIIEQVEPSRSHFTNEQFANALEYWVWKERQAKYITNSVRTYEFCGFDWWLPYWDVEFVDFWKHIPLSLRKNRLWYVDYVRQKYEKFEAHDVAKPLGNAEKSNPYFAFAKRLALKCLPVFIFERMRSKKISASIQNGGMNLGGLFEAENWMEKIDAGYRINGVFASGYLNELEAKLAAKNTNDEA